MTSDDHNEEVDTNTTESEVREELGEYFVKAAKQKAAQYEDNLLHRLVALKRDLDDSSLSQEEVNDELESILSEDPVAGSGEDELL